MNKKMKKVLSLILALAVVVSTMVGITISTTAITAEQTLIDEKFDAGVGGFAQVSRCNVTNTAAVASGMTGNVVVFDSSNSTNPVGYVKNLDSTVTGKQFVTMEFDIAAQLKATNRYLYFGVFDSNNNPLFSLDMIENAVAKISTNGGAYTNVTGMTQLLSYRVSATFNFVTKKQTIKIVPTADLTATPLVNATYDITTATNVAKLGMPVAITYPYGRIHLDNLLIKAPASYNVQFAVKDQNSVPVVGATFDFAGTSLTTDATGTATIELPAGSYSTDSTLSGYEKVTTPFDVTDSDKTIDVIMKTLAYTPEATSITIAGGQDYVYKPISGINTTTAYTATVYEQSNYLMPAEKVTWSIEPMVTGVSVDANTGVVSVDNTVAVDSNDGIDVTVKATSTTKATTTSTKALHIRNAKVATTFDIVGAGAIKKGQSATYSIANVKDQYGEAANASDYTFELSTNSANATTNGMVVTAGSITTDEEAAVLTATCGNAAFTKNIILYSCIFYDPAIGYTPYSANARYGAIGTETTLVWPMSSIPMTYTFPESIQFTPGTAVAVTWKDAWTVQTAMSQNRYLNIKDSAGVNVLPTITVVGGSFSFSSTEVIGSISGTQNTWSDLTLTVKTDLTGKSVAVIKLGTGTGVSKDIATGITNISSLNFSTASGLPNDRLIGIKEIKAQNVAVEDVSVTGSTVVAKVNAQTVTRTYVAKIFSQATGESFLWSLDQAYTGVAIDANTGVLSISDTATPGMIKVVCTSNLDATKTNYLTVDIKDFANIKDFTITAPALLSTGDTAKLSVSNILDEYGDSVVFTPVYTIAEGNNIATVSQDGTITVGNNLGVVKVDVKLGNPGKELTKQVAFNVAKFSDKYIVTPGETSHTFDVSILANTNNNTDYNITVISKDSGKVTVTVNDKILFRGSKANNKTQLDIVKTVNAVNGQVKVDFTGNVYSVEISPNFKFDFGAGAVADGYIGVTASTLFDGLKGYGFSVAGTTNGTNSKTGDLDSDYVSFGSSSFDVALPDGVYEFIFTKGDGSRASISVNNNNIGMNVDMGGWNKGTAGSTYRVGNVTVKGGKARVTLSSPYTTAISSVIIRKVSSDITRKTHVYVAGDSTVCNYFPVDYWTEPTGGIGQTGWAQVLKNYISNDMEVVDLAASGSWASGWYPTMTSVVENSRPGDYMIIAFGINDSKNSGNTVMLEYIEKMVADCVANGVIPIVTSPQGSGSGGSPALIKDIATSKGIFFVDNATLFPAFNSLVGGDWANRNYHGWNFTTDTLSDGTHLSFMGAKKVAELFTKDIYNQQVANTKDVQGKTLDGLKLNPQYSYLFTGGNLTDSQQTGTSYKSLISTTTDLKLWTAEFRDVNGNAMFTPQGDVVASVKAENETTTVKDIRVIVAAYDKNGVMTDVGLNATQINPRSTTNIDVNVNVPVEGKVKVMVFDGLDSLNPIYLVK